VLNSISQRNSPEYQAEHCAMHYIRKLFKLAFRNLWNKVSDLGFAKGKSSRANGSIFISAFHQFP